MTEQIDNLEQVGHAHMLDAIHGWAAVHAGLWVDTTSGVWRLKPPRRGWLSHGLDPTEHDSVTIGLDSGGSGTAYDTFTVTGPLAIDEVRMARTVLEVRRGEHLDFYSVSAIQQRGRHGELSV